MQFRVPQFIDIEDKLFGPLTFKQFAYLVGGGGLSFIIWKLLPWYLAIFLIAPIIALALALAFYKINNKPFISILESFLKFQTGSKLYLWKKEPTKVNQNIEEEKDTGTESVLPTLTSSKLKELSWSLDVLDNKEQQEQADDVDKIIEKSVKSKYDLKI